jgi:hypothetical protein
VRLKVRRTGMVSQEWRKSNTQDSSYRKEKNLIISKESISDLLELQAKIVLKLAPSKPSRNKVKN